MQGFRAKVQGVADGGFATAVGGRLLGDALDTAKSLADVGRQAKAIGADSAGFMALGQAAQKAGVVEGQFGELLGKFGVKVGGGLLGGDAAKALAQLGIQMDDVAGKPVDQQFLKVAEAISRITEAGLQASFATKLFGEQGLKLLPMLKQGEGGLKSFIESQKKMGAALGEGEMLKLEKVRAALPKLEAAFSGAWNKIVGAAAPLLEVIASRVTRLLDNARPFIDGFVHGFEVIARVGGAVLDELAAVFDAFYETVSAWVGESTAGLDTFALIEAVVGGIAQGVATVGSIFGEVGRTAAAIGATVLQGWVMILDDVKGVMADLLRGFASIPGISSQIGDDIRGWADSLEKTDFSATARDLGEFADRNWFDTDRLKQNVQQSEQWIGRAMRKKKELETPAVIPVVPQLAASEAGNVLGAALLAGTADEYSAWAKAEVGGGSVMHRILATNKGQQKSLEKIAENTAPDKKARAADVPQDKLQVEVLP